MVATEIFLIAAGVICVVVSVVMSFGDDKENVESSAKAELTQAQPPSSSARWPSASCSATSP